MGYVWGWVICLAATAGVIACGFRMTRAWRPAFVRDLVRGIAIATFLVPVTAGSSEGFWAPAYIVVGFEALLQVDGDPIPALSALTLGWGAALLVVVGLEARRRLQRRA
jgi:hypothetical protein